MNIKTNQKMASRMLRTMLLVAAALSAAVGVSYAAPGDAFMGTWQLNVAKSKLPADAPKSLTVVYSNAGDNIKLTADGTGADGQSLHFEWTGKFDGKDYPATGDPDVSTVSFRIINSHTLLAINKKNGKVVSTERNVVSADGKSRTVTDHETDAKGMKTTSIVVFDKE
jgi:hypothetical protein